MKMKMAPKDGLTLLPCFYFVELPIVVSSMLSLYLLELQPAQGGYRCHQPSLSLPYVGPGTEAVPLLMLLSLAFAGPAATIMVGEGLVYALHRPAGGCSFNSFLRRTMRFVGVHVFGLCATALVTDVLQLSTGYHAPFFLTVCQPNYTLLSVPCDLNPFVHQDICSGHDRHAILTARKTFPSQHATLAAFAAVYVSMYLDQAVPACPRLLKPVLVLGFWLAAGLAGLTQVTRHRSHAHDVWAGGLIGAFIAAYLACHAVGNFRPLEAAPPGGPAPPDALRALAERGHDSVYNRGPASASQSNDQICGAPGGAEGAPGGAEGAPGSGGGPAGGLQRASLEAELRAPRETMVTFSHTLPRAGQGPKEPGSTWQQRVTDRRREGGSEAAQGPPAVRRGPGGHGPDAGAPAVSPKSALTRAKWLAITEKTTGKMSNKKSKKREGTMQLTGKGHGEGRGNVKGKGKAGSWAEHGLGVEQRGSAVA
ncbi:phospholipid phosphatase-related protein type 3 [Gadus chalcogrammus]|uniref:phospholipid phosphatase-related protein type 3 n=1 Tax=Gadus chalcogrammus TaxID=1042646 RepID=UPI0024C47916|nr:phospholipid phosphatase-related protein type 3 [Gadus chalcogrammus]